MKTVVLLLHLARTCEFTKNKCIEDRAQKFRHLDILQTRSFILILYGADYCLTNQTVCLYVSSQSADSIAQALVHNVNIAAQLSSMVSLTHVTVMVIPTGALLGQLEEGLVP